MGYNLCVSLDIAIILALNYSIRCCSEKVFRACKVNDEYGVVRHTVQERERNSKSLLPATGIYATPGNECQGTENSNS